MARLRYNGLQTTLGGTGLDAATTTITFAAALTHSGGTSVPTITGTDYIPLAILNTAGALTEIVYLTAYTSGATTGTISRGQEGTTAVTHAAGDKVVNALTVADVTSTGTTSKTARYKRTTTSSAFGDGASITVAWEAADWDDWDGSAPVWAAGSPTRITCQEAGTYRVTARTTITNGVTAGARILAYLAKNPAGGGASTNVDFSVAHAGAVAWASTTSQCVIKLAAGDYLTLVIENNGGGSMTLGSDTRIELHRL